MMIGDTTVGKTSLLVRYADDDFNESVLATIGIDFKIKVLLRHLWLCAAWPLPAARCGPAPPLARRLSTSMARRSSCRFGTLPARCVAPVHHHARSECPVLQVGQAGVASLTQARPLHGRSASARSRKLTTAAPWASFSFTCAGPFESGDGRPAETPVREPSPVFASPAQPVREPSPASHPAQDVTSTKTWSNIRNWVRNIEANAPQTVNKILIGNKRARTLRRLGTLLAGAASAPPPASAVCARAVRSVSQDPRYTQTQVRHDIHATGHQRPGR